RTEWPEQEQQRLDRLAHQRRPLLARLLGGGGLKRMELADELHDRADRGVEVEGVLDIGGHAVYRLADGPAEGPSAVRERVGPDGRRPPELVRVRQREPPHPVQEARRALDAVIVPVEIPLGGRRRTREDTRRGSSEP